MTGGATLNSRLRNDVVHGIFLYSGAPPPFMFMCSSFLTRDATLFSCAQTDGHVHYRDIELIASKTYIREVVLIIIYSEGSFFVTLSAGVTALRISMPDPPHRCVRLKSVIVVAAKIPQ